MCENFSMHTCLIFATWPCGENLNARTFLMRNKKLHENLPIYGSKASSRTIGMRLIRTH